MPASASRCQPARLDELLSCLTAPMCMLHWPADAPVRADQTRQRTYKTKEETEKSKTVTSTVVLSLLLIACVVPMLQYYGYTARD